jgi:hypothetical protein
VGVNSNASFCSPGQEGRGMCILAAVFRTPPGLDALNNSTRYAGLTLKDPVSGKQSSKFRHPYYFTNLPIGLVWRPSPRLREKLVMPRITRHLKKPGGMRKDSKERVVIGCHAPNHHLAAAGRVPINSAAVC